jgi:hypothetical protein
MKRQYFNGCSIEAFVVTILFFIVTSCRGCPKDIVSAKRNPALGAVVVREASSEASEGLTIKLDESRLSLKVRKILEEAEIFASQDTTKTSANVNLSVEILDGKGGDVDIGAKIRLKVGLRPVVGEGQKHFIDDIEAVGQAPVSREKKDDRQAVLQRLVERIIADVMFAYIRRQKLWEAPEPEIAAILSSDDEDLRIEAMRIVGVRKLHGQVPAVIRLLTDQSESIRDAALGTLVAMRERSSIKALAQSHEMRDAREMRKILDAIASLGGQEAREFLGFVAETHDDEEIREMARAALERLQRRDVMLRPTK